MANYTSLRGPVGLNRTYIHVPGKTEPTSERRDAWLESLKSGASIATNGPIVALTVEGRPPGSEIELGRGSNNLSYSGFLRSAVPIDHLELVYNGKVVATFDIEAGGMSADIRGRINAGESGWLLLRAWNDDSHGLIFDVYPYATTSPVYLSVNGKAPRSKDDAAYFLKWIGNIRAAAESREDYNSDAERGLIMSNIAEAERFYEACRSAGFSGSVGKFPGDRFLERCYGRS